MKKSLFYFATALSLLAFDGNTEYKNYMNELKNEEKLNDPKFSDFDANRGKEIFFSKHKVDGSEISCASCHSNNLKQNGKNFKTNKTIEPLSPLANKLRLTSQKEMKKWLKRNFNDVYRREGTAKEKGDVLAFISQN